MSIIIPYNHDVLHVNVKVPAAFSDLFLKDYRTYVCYGGRGGAKTTTICIKLLLDILQEPNDKQFIYFCGRETMEQLRHSTYPVIANLIKEYGLSEYFRLREYRGDILCRLNQGKFLFGGLRDVSSLKSTESIRRLAVDECQSGRISRGLTEEAYNIIRPTVREEGSKMFFSFNPYLATDFCYENWVSKENTSDRLIVKKVNYDENPYLSKVMLDDIDEDKSEPNKFNHVWLGAPCSGDMLPVNPLWWKYYNHIDDIRSKIRTTFLTVDSAYKTGANNDYTVIQLWGMEHYHKMFLLDQWRGKWQFPQQVLNVKKALQTSDIRTTSGRIIKPLYVYIEDKASGIAIVQVLRQQGIVAKAWTPKAFGVPNDKMGRLSLGSVAIERGLVWLPKEAMYTRDLLYELSLFDGSGRTHDDQIDALTMALSVFMQIGGAAVR